MSWNQIQNLQNGNINTTDNILDIKIPKSQTNVINKEVSLPANNFTFIYNELILLDGIIIEEGAFLSIEGENIFNNINNGMIIPYAGNWSEDIMQKGFLICDGRYLSIKDYYDLFLIIGFKFGRDYINNKFKIPNLMGKFLIGQDNRISSIDTIGKEGGSKEIYLNINNLPSHRHLLKADINYEVKKVVLTSYAANTSFSVSGVGSYSQNRGGTQPIPNIPPAKFINFLIKYN